MGERKIKKEEFVKYVELCQNIFGRKNLREGVINLQPKQDYFEKLFKSDLDYHLLVFIENLALCSTYFNQPVEQLIKCFEIMFYKLEE